MLRYRFSNIGLIKYVIGLFLREKRSYSQRYEKILMRWGSGLFWIYFFQCGTGVLLSIAYILSLDVGLPAILYLWWETSHGSFLIRLHSEFGNLVFFFLYCHVFTKFWTFIDITDADAYMTWISGTVIYILTYLVGVTGAIMPCSILSEVTATIVGSAISSIIYVKFDFLETFIVPGMSLNEESIWRSYIIHAVVPLFTFLVAALHMLLLHKNKYSGAGGFKKLNLTPKFREERRWRYLNRYWNRAFGTWYRLMFSYLVCRFIAEIFWPATMTVSYNYSNLDYWPINENIDFVLAIPHWYLRPLMGALVTIPHHYLGFLYIILVFGVIILIPWLYETNSSDSWGFPDTADGESWTTNRWDFLNNITFFTFLFGAFFMVAVVPTGKYFLSIGSMDGLVLAYWLFALYLILLVRLGFIFLKLFFVGFFF